MNVKLVLYFVCMKYNIVQPNSFDPRSDCFNCSFNPYGIRTLTWVLWFTPLVLWVSQISHFYSSISISDAENGLRRFGWIDMESSTTDYGHPSDLAKVTSCASGAFFPDMACACVYVNLNACNMYTCIQLFIYTHILYTHVRTYEDKQLNNKHIHV